MLVIRPMSLVSTLARSAAPMPTSTAIAEMTTTRWSTGLYSGGASTVASAGASDGATGNPLAAFNGVSVSSGTPHPSGRLVFEHHRWRGEVDTAGENPRLEEFGESRALLGRHTRHTMHQIALDGGRRAGQHALAGWR